VKFSVPGAGQREGWFFRVAGSATIVLCHGYGSSRGELLTWFPRCRITSTRVVFDFVAHGANDGITSFGYHEADEVRAAIDELAKRSDVILTISDCGATTWAPMRPCARPKATNVCTL